MIIRPSLSEPAAYRIRVKGVLDARWAEQFDGMTLSADQGDTILSGIVPDQPALHRLLVKIRDLGLVLISVNCIDSDPLQAPRFGAEPALRSPRPEGVGSEPKGLLTAPVERVADRTRELATLNAIAAAVSRSLDLEELLCDSLAKALEVLDFESGAIYLRDLTTGDLQMGGCQGGLSDVFRRVEAGGILSAKVAASGDPLIIDDLLGRPDAPEEIVGEGYRSLASFPLISKGQVEGVLTVASRRAHTFRQPDVELLLSIGHQMGVAIENARLFKAEQRRAEQFRVISKVGQRITSTLAVDEVLEQLTELIHQAFDYYLVEIGLVEEDEIVFRAGAGGTWGSGFESFRLGANRESVTGYAVVSGESIRVTDVNREPRYVKIAATGSRSELAVPLKAKDKVIGVLNVESDRLNAFDDSDLVVLQALADQAAIAIEKARLFEAEQRRAEQFKLIGEVSRRVASILAIDELLEQIAGLIQRTFDYYLVDIGLIAEGELVYKAGAGRPWESGFKSFRLPLDQKSITGCVAASGAALIVPDVNQDPRYVNVADADTRSELAVPLKTEERVIGVLNIESDRLNAFDASDLAVLQSLADQAAIAIEKARLFRAEQRRAEQFRVISEVGRRITSILDIDELLQQMARLIQQAFNYYHVGIGLIDATADEVVYKVGAGPLWDDPNFQFKPARLKVGQEGITGWVAATGQFLLAPDVSREPRYVWMRGSITRSELAVAVKAKGSVVGVLDVQSDRLNAFDETDVAVLQSLADQAGVAIQNARLYEDEQRRAEQFRVIGELGQHITSILPVDELLERVVRLIQEAFGYYAVGIGLVEGDEVVFKAGAGAFWDASQLYRTLRLQVGRQGFTGWVAQTGEPLLVNDVSQDSRYYFAPQAGETRSEMTVPLKIKGAVIGVLGVQSDRLNAFDASDLAVLQSLAHQAAVAIENARLVERAKELAVVEERNRLSRELHDAVTQTLFSASLIGEVLPRLWERDPEEARQRLEDLRKMTRGALAEMRTLLLELRPAVLAETELSDLLRQLAEATTGRTRVTVTAAVEGQCSPPPDVKVALYRIAQEALNNMAKHAGAGRATIGLRCVESAEQKSVELRVSDDGRGFDPAGVTSDHLGLGIMRERAEAVGAALTVDSAIGRGTQVTVVWTGEGL